MPGERTVTRRVSMRWCSKAAAATGAALVASSLLADATPTERGEKALLGRAFNARPWTARAYRNAWRQWETRPTPPARDYGQAFREHYGLHPAPYPNGQYPMGLRE